MLTHPQMQSLLPPQHLILLQSLACHAVDDRVATGVDVPHAVRNDEDSDGEENAQPEDDVEHGREVVKVVPCQVVVWNVVLMAETWENNKKTNLTWSSL